MSADPLIRPNAASGIAWLLSSLRAWAARVVWKKRLSNDREDRFSEIIDRLYSIGFSGEHMAAQPAYPESLPQLASEIVRDPQYNLTDRQSGEILDRFSAGFRGSLFSVVAMRSRGHVREGNVARVPEAVLVASEMIGARLAQTVLAQAGKT